MAGSASNWYKNPKAGAKGSVYISRADVALYLRAIDSDATITEGQRMLRADPTAIEELVAVFRPQPPNGVAQSGGARPPSEPPDLWAQDERAQSLIAAQEAMRREGDGDPLASFNQEMVRAFRKDSPNVGVMTGFDYENEEFHTLPEEYESLVRYTLDTFWDINADMWGRTLGDGRDLGASVDSILNIQQLLLRGSAPFDMTVTRAVNNEHPLARWAEMAQPGDSYINQGFDSSSLDPSINLFGSDVRLFMRIPKGSHGAYINSVFPTNTQHTEYEWLIPANGTWVVTGKTVAADGKIDLTVELVDQRMIGGDLVWPQDTRKPWQK